MGGVGEKRRTHLRQKLSDATKKKKKKGQPYLKLPKKRNKKKYHGKSIQQAKTERLTKKKRKAGERQTYWEEKKT